MYAVVKTGGKQYKVAIGDKLKVEKLAAEEGASVDLGNVLMIADGGDVTVGTPTLETAVTATILAHGRDRKIRVFKMKRRKGYRRTQGHRQFYTEVEITGIGSSVVDAKPAKNPAEKTESSPEPEIQTDSASAVDYDVENGGDKLTTINGIGPVIEKKLVALGISTFKQIAALDQEQIDEINSQLSFKGRIEREQWVEQAKELIG